MAQAAVKHNIRRKMLLTESPSIRPTGAASRNPEAQCPVAELLQEMAPIYAIFKKHEMTKLGQKSYDAMAEIEKNVSSLRAQSNQGALLQTSLCIAELDLIAGSDLDSLDLKGMLGAIRGMLASVAEHLNGTVGKNEASDVVDWYRSADYTPKIH